MEQSTISPAAGLPAPASFLQSDTKRVSGKRAGPTLYVHGRGDAVRAAYARVLALPNLAWFRGTLVLGDSQATDTSELDASLRLGAKREAQDAYWDILRFCTRFGMIAGRGVPMNTTARLQITQHCQTH